MQQFQISFSNAVTGFPRRARRISRAGFVAAAIAVGALLVPSAVAQGDEVPARTAQDGGAPTKGAAGKRSAKKGADEKPAPTAEERAAAVKRRKARAAAKQKAERAATGDVQRIAAALKQISEGLEKGEIEPAQAFRLIEGVKKSWIETSNVDSEAASASADAAGPAKKRRAVAQAEAAAKKEPAAKKGAAAKKPGGKKGPTAAQKAAAVKAKAARAKSARVKAARLKELKKKREAAAVPASAPRRSAAASAKTFKETQEELTELVATYNTTERRLNIAVSAGEISRAAANRQLQRLQDQLAIASGAVSAKQKPKDSIRYKAKQRELSNAVARGLMSERKAQAELRIVLDAVTAEMELKKEAAASARERLSAAEAQAAPKKAAPKRASAKKANPKKATSKKKAAPEGKAVPKRKRVKKPATKPAEKPAEKQPADNGGQPQR